MTGAPELPETIEALRTAVRTFADHEVRPRVAAMEAAGSLDAGLVRQMAEIGLFGALFSEAQGGSGLGELGFVIVQEEISRAHLSTGLLLAASSGLAARLIAMFGTPQQQQRWLDPLARGERTGAFCLTEPAAGSDVPAMQMRASLDGDAYVLDGEKSFITNGSGADVLLVFAKTAPEERGRGISLFVVERGTPRLSVVRTEEQMGLLASPTAQLIFDGVRVPASNMLGQPGEGLAMALACLNRSRLGIAAMCLGAAREALALAWRYTQERVIGGRALAEQQVTQHALAEMEIDIFATESMVYRTAALADAGGSIEREASICKVFATEAAQRIVDRALQLHGGAGYIRGAEIERLYRDIRAARIYEGANEVQRNNIYRVMRRERGS